jgi:N-acetylmuramoyl-L-alanine amidase
MLKTLTKSRTLVILDAGHGIDTPGKRSPVWKDGTQLFEWEFNRAVVAIISRYLTASNISNIKLVVSDVDVSLKARSSQINELYEKYKDTYFVYLLSIHGNAANSPRANGIEAFTTEGITVCDKIADMYLKELEALGWKMRYNNKTKLNKDLDFWILKQTNCPSILTENGFYTNEEECRKMMDRYWRNQIALAHIRAAVKIEFDESITYELV